MAIMASDLGMGATRELIFQTETCRVTQSLAGTGSGMPLSVKVGVEHLKFWYAAAEPVYLVVYVESADEFVGVDGRELVEHEWRQDFYAAMRGRGGEVTVHVPTAAVMNANRIAALVQHRSMRIDGPTFRGRPLGHRVDPLRSVLAPPAADVWERMVTRVLQAHDFREVTRSQVGDLTFIRGTIAQTLMWQSPAFAEYGYRYHGEVRDEPAPEQLFGEVHVILDSDLDQNTFTDDEARALSKATDAAAEGDLDIALLFRGRDLSGTGGLWRSAVREPRGFRTGDAQDRPLRWLVGLGHRSSLGAGMSRGYP